jgi:tRNA 2-selenouridine synthase
MEVRDFSDYSLVIDARSPHEYAEDHLPSSVNLPVVNDTEYAEVGIKHKDDTHAAYLIGVEYSLRNIAEQIKPLIARYARSDRLLVYCFRGGKRSKLWADNLRTIGFEVDVLRGGWKTYRRWVRASLETLPLQLNYRVLSGPTGSGKTRLLYALKDAGEQIVDLEAIANHRGSLIGAIPGQNQPTQKYFDTLLLDQLRHLNPERPVWLEAESRKIGNLQLPITLFEAMQRATHIQLKVPITERVKLWRQDYPHFAIDPVDMVSKLAPLKPLIGGDELNAWRELSSAGRVDELFERVMVNHYDPCYARSGRRDSHKDPSQFELSSLDPVDLRHSARLLAAQFGQE